MSRALGNVAAFIITAAIVLLFCIVALPQGGTEEQASFAIEMPRVDLTMHPKMKHGSDAARVCNEINEKGGYQFISWLTGQVMVCTDDPYEGDGNDIIGVAFFATDAILAGGGLVLVYLLLTAYRLKRRRVRKYIERDEYEPLGRFRR